MVLLRFPERRLQKRYERIFITVMAAWLLSTQAISAVTWPCWATPKNMTIWPWWLANCGLSDLAELAIYWGQAVFAAGLISLLTLRILRTRGLDRRIYVPVHIASIFGVAAFASLAGMESCSCISALSSVLETLPGILGRLRIFERCVRCPSCHTGDALSGQYFASPDEVENRWNGGGDKSRQDAREHSSRTAASIK